MKRRSIRRAQICGVVVLAAFALPGRAGELDGLLDDYRAQGVGAFDPTAGNALWRMEFDGKSCTSCHTDSPRNPGRHERTGKPIKPMAPSTNPERLTDSRQIKKWLLRNCKSTLGRECTTQEKGDVLTWLRGQ
jgi:hypothetical protein